MSQRSDRDSVLVSTLLVKPGELAAELAQDRPPVLLDVRWRLAGPPGIDSYRQGHLPGAVFADLDRDLAAPPGPAGRHPLPEPAAFQAAMRAAGVSRDRPVVVYDDRAAMSAARGWWTLRYFGHPDVRVLDGGYRAWAGAGLPVSKDEPAPVPGDFTAQPGQMPVLDAGRRPAAGADRAAAGRAGGRALPAARPSRSNPVAGHIPGAVSAPTAGNVNPDGTFKDPAGLAARFAGLGAAPGAPVGAYCGSGVTAAHEVLALRASRHPRRALHRLLVQLGRRSRPARGIWSRAIRLTAGRRPSPAPEVVPPRHQLRFRSRHRAPADYLLPPDTRFHAVRASGSAARPAFPAGC